MPPGRAALSRRDRTIGTAWSLAVAAVGIALVAAFVVVLRDPSAELFGRWTLATFLLTAPLIWSARHHRGTLRRYYGRGHRVRPSADRGG